MANRTSKKPSRSSAPPKITPAASRSTENAPLYLYGITAAPKTTSQVPRALAVGVDGSGKVEPLECKGFVCWVSRVDSQFAESLPANMENLDWLAGAGVRHQKVVAELARHQAVLPARFGTVFLGRASLEKDVARRSPTLASALERVSDADEWGIKIFRLTPRAQTVIDAASGSDYLRQKAKVLESELQQRGRARTPAPEIQKFASQLKKFASAVVPGGSLTQAQPGVEWHSSILLPRPMQKKFQSAISHFSAQWQGSRRIEVTGPWPPYSFVKD